MINQANTTKVGRQNTKHKVSGKSVSTELADKAFGGIQYAVIGPRGHLVRAGIACWNSQTSILGSLMIGGSGSEDGGEPFQRGWYDLCLLLGQRNNYWFPS